MSRPINEYNDTFLDESVILCAPTTTDAYLPQYGEWGDDEYTDAASNVESNALDAK